MADATSIARTAGTSAAPLGFSRIMIVIGAIYCAQSIVGGLTFAGVPAVLRSQGVSLELIGVFYLLMLPWAVKFAWAPRVERWRRGEGGDRSRQLVVTGQVATALMLGLVAFISPKDAPLALFAALAVIGLLAATVDIATDGFAIERLRVLWRGWANVAQVGGAYLGFAIGSGLFLVLVDQAGWRLALVAAMAAVLLAALPMALTPTRERSIGAMPERSPSLAHAFARPEIRHGLVIVILFQTGIRLALAITHPFLVDQGMDLALLGIIAGTGSTMSSLIGVLTGGLIASRLSMRQALLTCLAGQIAVLGLLALAAYLDVVHPALLGAILLATSFVLAAGFVALYTAMMRWSSPQQAGVDFSLFQCADAATAALMGPVAGMVAGGLGYDASFSLAIAAAAAAMIGIPILLRRSPARAGGEDARSPVVTTSHQEPV